MIGWFLKKKGTNTCRGWSRIAYTGTSDVWKKTYIFSIWRKRHICAGFTSRGLGLSYAHEKSQGCFGPTRRKIIVSYHYYYYYYYFLVFSSYFFFETEAKVCLISLIKEIKNKK
jgi:hypothetical protein